MAIKDFLFNKSSMLSEFEMICYLVKHSDDQYFSLEYHHPSISNPPASLSELDAMYDGISIGKMMIEFHEGDAQQNTQYGQARRSEKSFWLRLYFYKYLGDRGETTICLVKNINKEIDAQDDIRKYSEYIEKLVDQKTRDLSVATKELEDFIYATSHDLQTPLSIAISFSDLIEQHLKDEDIDNPIAMQYVKEMKESLNWMDQLLQSLLQYSRVTNRPAAYSTVNLRSLIETVVQALSIKISSIGGECFIHGDEIHINANEYQIKQLVQNLLENAIKFASPQRPLAVNIYLLEFTDDNGSPMVRLIVADNGIGFKQKHAKKIFNLFQRLHNRDDIHGTGMGLAICNKIALKHGGSIFAEAEEDVGASFIVEFRKDGGDQEPKQRR